jgi:hypothetical protein
VKSDTGLIRCPKCALWWPPDEFARDKSKASGRKAICRPCDSKKAADYYAANRQARLEYAARRAAASLGSKPRRKCARCDSPATSNRHTLCDVCRKKARARARGRGRHKARNLAPTAERGYGPAHKKLRKQVAAIVERGVAVCWRCGLSIDPSESWDLGHDDVDRSRYIGPEHRACSRATAGRRKPAPRIASRAW